MKKSRGEKRWMAGESKDIFINEGTSPSPGEVRHCWSPLGAHVLPPSLEMVVKEGPRRGVKEHWGEKTEVWGVVYLTWGPRGHTAEGDSNFQEQGGEGRRGQQEDDKNNSGVRGKETCPQGVTFLVEAKVSRNLSHPRISWPQIPD